MFAAGVIDLDQRNLLLSRTDCQLLGCFWIGLIETRRKPARASGSAATCAYQMLHPMVPTMPMML
jgi:hypothetical protein